MSKKLVIVGGANGVGKTTFAHQYKKEFGIEYLCVDDISKELSESYTGNLELKAGKEFFRHLDFFLKKNRSVIIESTLSGIGLIKKIQEFKRNGYSLYFIYVFLNNVDLCKKRIEFRVKKGGYSVPIVEIERRFYRSLKNFKKIYMHLADKWQLFYNGFERPIEVAIGENREIMIIDEEFYQKFLEISK